MAELAIDKEISVIVDTINTACKDKTAAMTLSMDYIPCKVQGYINTQSDGVNDVIGQPGIPLGRLTEISGPEASGKSTLCAHILAQCQQDGGIAALIDTEQAYDPIYAARIGVDNGKLIVMQADVLEEVFTKMEVFIETIKQRNKMAKGERKVVVVFDSVAGTPAKAELEGDADDKHMGVAARVIRMNLRRITQLVAKEQIGLVFTNQEYSKMGSYGGTTTYGGGGIKYHASLRLRLNEVGKLEEAGEVIGSEVEVYGLKNKVSRPFKKRKIVIVHGFGIDNQHYVFEKAKDLGIVQKNGSWYTYNRLGVGGEVIEEVKFQGYNGFKEKITGKALVGLLQGIKHIEEKRAVP